MNENSYATYNDLTEEQLASKLLDIMDDIATLKEHEAVIRATLTDRMASMAYHAGQHLTFREHKFIIGDRTDVSIKDKSLLMWTLQKRDPDTYKRVTRVDINTKAFNALVRDGGNDVTREAYDAGLFDITHRHTLTVRKNKEDPKVEWKAKYGGKGHRAGM